MQVTGDSAGAHRVPNPWLALGGGAPIACIRGEAGPARPLAVGALKREQARAPALGRDARSFRSDHLSRCADEVAQRLPPDRRVALEEPVDKVTLGEFQPTALQTSAAILASASGVSSRRAKEVAHIGPSSSFAGSLNPKVAYRALNLAAL